MQVLLRFVAVGAGGSSGPAGTRRHELIVVASLIDKVPNLAGLARTAEVLGAGTLVLADIRVASDQLFTRSVTPVLAFALVRVSAHWQTAAAQTSCKLRRIS